MLRRVEVAVRVRPAAPSGHDVSSCVSLDEERNTITAVDANGMYASSHTRPYREDILFNEEATNREIFERLILEKMHSATEEQPDTLCFLAYGHTSSGKTHAIAGGDEEPGLLTMCVEELLQREGVVEVAMLEVYMDTVQDLLAQGEPRRVRRRQGPDGGHAIIVEGLTTCSLVSLAQWHAVSKYGMQSRRTAPTERNPRSSRSHAIFTLKSRSVRMCLVDLAGSERQSVFSPQLNRESIAINKSLSRLSTVLEALSSQKIREDGSRSYVNFRDTTLTVLLQRYLCGASMTTFLACVHPAAQHYQETLSTLRYTQRLKRVRTTVVRPDTNEMSGLHAHEHQGLLDELARLRQQFKDSLASNKMMADAHKVRIAELEAALAHQKASGGGGDGVDNGFPEMSSRAKDKKRVAGWLLSRVLGDLPQLNVGYDEYFDGFFPADMQVIGYVSTMACLAPRDEDEEDSGLAFLDVGDFAMGLSMMDAGIPPFVRLHRAPCHVSRSWEGHEWDAEGHMVYVLAFFEVKGGETASGSVESIPDTDGGRFGCCGGYVSSESMLPIATVLCVPASTPAHVKESVLQRLISLQGEQEEAMRLRGDESLQTFSESDEGIDALLDQSLIQQQQQQSQHEAEMGHTHHHRRTDTPTEGSSDSGLGREIARQSQNPKRVHVPYRASDSSTSDGSLPVSLVDKQPPLLPPTEKDELPQRSISPPRATAVATQYTDGEGRQRQNNITVVSASDVHMGGGSVEPNEDDATQDMTEHLENRKKKKKKRSKKKGDAEDDGKAVKYEACGGCCVM